MSEQMNYSTYGHTRHRRTNNMTRKLQHEQRRLHHHHRYEDNKRPSNSKKRGNNNNNTILVSDKKWNDRISFATPTLISTSCSSSDNSVGSSYYNSSYTNTNNNSSSHDDDDDDNDVVSVMMISRSRSRSPYQSNSHNGSSSSSDDGGGGGGEEESEYSYGDESYAASQGGEESYVSEEEEDEEDGYYTSSSSSYSSSSSHKQCNSNIGETSTTTSKKDKLLSIMKSSVKVVPILTSNSCKKLMKHHQQHQRNVMLHDSDAYLFKDYKYTTTTEKNVGMKGGGNKSDGSNMTYYTRSSSGGYSYSSCHSSNVEKEGRSEYKSVAASSDNEQESFFKGRRKDSILDPPDCDDEESYISGCNDVDNDDSFLENDSSDSDCDSNISIKQNVPTTQDKMLVELLQENEMLRTSINSIRIDFEKMLHQIQHDPTNNNNNNNNDQLGLRDSISTCTDESGITNCLRQIEYVKIQTMEKMCSLLEEGKLLLEKHDEDGKNDNDDYDFREEQQQQQQDLLDSSSSSSGGKEDQCVVDLLREENQRLCKYIKIAMINQEHEDILLQHSKNGTTTYTAEKNDEDNKKPQESTRVDAGDNHDDHETSRRLLTDEGVAISHSKCLNDIATLIHGIGNVSPSSSASTTRILEEQKDTTSAEVLKLVSKILSQRAVVGVVPPPSSTTSTIDNKTKIDPPSWGVAEQEDPPPDKYASNCSVVSVHTVLSQDDSDVEENRKNPYVVTNVLNEMSSNSLFDGPSPSMSAYLGRRGLNVEEYDDDGDDDVTLEIVYEYYSSDSSYSTGSEATSYHQSRSRSRQSTHSSPSYSVEDIEDARYHNSFYSSTHASRNSPSISRRSRHGRHRADRFIKRYSPVQSVSPGRHRSRSRSSRSPGDSRSSKMSSSTGSSSSPLREETIRSRIKTPPRASPHLYWQPNDDCAGSGARNAPPPSVPDLDEHDVLSQTQDHDIDDTISRAADDDDVQSQFSHYYDNNNNEQEEELTNTIERHLDSCIPMMKSPNNSSEENIDTSCATSTEDNSSESTRERRGISISVVSRSSRHVSFPSSQEHTYVTYFVPTLTKQNVDAVLEEQFRDTRETLESSIMTHRRTNCAGGSKASKKNRLYQGEYNEDGQRHGYGIYTSKNGNEYRGEWQNDKREGLGVVKVGNGDVFEGQFECNLKNGIGVYHYQDGECDLSRYKDDARVGDSIRYSKNRQQAFLLTERGSSKAIALDEAALAAKYMGTIVAC